MNTSLKTITNPMTLIAIFATISQSSAAISLPFLDDQDREYYLWFLISFPFYLLLLFFITLNFNYRSLYSPSDYRKSKHFIKTMGDARDRQAPLRATAIKRLIVALRKETRGPRLIVVLMCNEMPGGFEMLQSKDLEQVVKWVAHVIYDPADPPGASSRKGSVSKSNT